MLGWMRITPFVVALALASTACGGDPTFDDSSSDDSAELRALQAGDVDRVILADTPAVNQPEALRDIAMWSVDYVEMDDPNPDNRYNGLMLLAKDSQGIPRYLLPVAISEQGTVLSVFRVSDDGSGGAEPLAYDTTASDPEEAARGQLVHDWLRAEFDRLADRIDQTYADPGGAGLAASSLPALGGSTVSTQGLSEPERALLECAAQLATFALRASIPETMIFAAVANAAVALLDNNPESSEVSQSAATTTSLGGLVLGVRMFADYKGWKVVASRGGPAILGALIAYGVAAKAVSGASAGTVIKDTLTSLIPKQCRDSFTYLTSVVKAPPATQ